MTATQISGLTAIGATGLVSTNANVSYTSDQTAAILSSRLSVSASGSHTVTENFANGDYSVYQGGQLIRQKSVNPDGSYDIAYFNVAGQTSEAIYNSAKVYVATAQDNANGSGNLLVYANGLTITTLSGSESVTVGSDTFALVPHSVETTTIERTKTNTLRSKETFVFGPGFGQDTIAGFLTTTASHDLLQFSASMFGFSSTSSQTADARALLNSFATGTTNTTITDLQGDSLTLNGVTIATLKAHLGRLQVHLIANAADGGRRGSIRAQGDISAMCGIVGVLGRRPVAGPIVDALKRLEYRGYDSSGVATLENGRLERRRAEGKLKNLEAKLAARPLAGAIGIGHTR